MNIGIFVSVLGGASIDFIETAAIAYAIARSGYPREAISGTIVGLVVAVIAVLVMGTQLQAIPLEILQIAIGIMLLWFGFGWVKKSVLRQVEGKRAGWVNDPLPAEAIALETPHTADFNFLNFTLITKSAILEAIRVGNHCPDWLVCLGCGDRLSLVKEAKISR